ncbi:PQQ-binding-like beta-propeller repeat protein [Maribacter sp. Asnod1-A12]|uniref:PQQ-binding-like beta-propeller repeat protein n=1 Tax=Maribacter sp. Asnod1-A12 TaxID=3160576 RepID=UPI003866A0D3
MKNYIKSSSFFILCFLSIFIIGCTKDAEVALNEDGEVINPEQGNKIVSGDPVMNSFIMTTWDESIVKLDATTGEEEIVYTLPDYIYPESLPDYSNGVLYIASDDNSVNAVDVNTNSFLWDTPMLEYHNASGISNTNCEGGICYTSGGYGVVVALFEGSGDIKWHYSTDLNGELDDVLNEATTPIVYQDKVYIFSEEDFLEYYPAYMHVLDKETGALLSKVELPNDISSVPVIENNMLYLPAKNMYAIDLSTLQVRWSFEAEGVSAPQVTEDKVLFGGIPADDTIHSALYCLDKETGAFIWGKETGFDTLWSPTVVENVVFGVHEKGTSFIATNGRPFALRLSDGEELWYRDSVSCDTTPVYANGMLYFHGHNINASSDSDEDVGLIAMDANTGDVIWLNNIFGNDRAYTPIVIAQNGVFGPGYFR